MGSDASNGRVLAREQLLLTVLTSLKMLLDDPAHPAHAKAVDAVTLLGRYQPTSFIVTSMHKLSAHNPHPPHTNTYIYTP